MRLLGYSIVLVFHLPFIGCSSASLSDAGSGSPTKKKADKEVTSSVAKTKSTSKDLEVDDKVSTSSQTDHDLGIEPDSDGPNTVVDTNTPGTATDTVTATATDTDVNSDLEVSPPPTPPSTTTFTLLENAGHAFPATNASATYLWSTQTVDTTYYRNLELSYELDLTCAFLGYAPHPSSYFKNFCNNNPIRVNPPAPSKKAYKDSLANCGSPIITLQWGSGHFYCGSTLSVHNIVVRGIKDPPVATDQSIEVTQNDATPYINLNASDPQSAPLVVRMTAHPHHGTLLWNGSQFSYTPSSCYSGSDSFQYYVVEKIRNLPSRVATVSINVKAASSSNCP